MEDLAGAVLEVVGLQAMQVERCKLPVSVHGVSLPCVLLGGTRASFPPSPQPWGHVLFRRHHTNALAAAINSVSPAVNRHVIFTAYNGLSPRRVSRSFTRSFCVVRIQASAGNSSDQRISSSTSSRR